MAFYDCVVSGGWQKDIMESIRVLNHRPTGFHFLCCDCDCDDLLLLRWGLNGEAAETLGAKRNSTLKRIVVFSSRSFFFL